MNEFVFDREFSPWEMALSKLKEGSTISARRFIALMEQDPSVEPELAAMELQQRGIMLEITDLPRVSGSGQTTARLELEERLCREGTLMENLEDHDPLKLMLLQMKSIAPLDDEQKLACNAAGGDESAMELLAQAYLPLVYELACGFVGRGVLLMDLIQEGSLGLWQGVLNYEAGSFREHSVWWIRQAMARVVTLQAYANGVGQHMAKAMERYRKADRELLTRLGRNPGDEEIAQEMGVTPEEAAAVGKMLREVESMDRVRRADIPKEPDPEDDQAVENTAYFQSRQRINEMLSTLPEQDARILTMRYGLDGKAPLTSQQAAQKLGLSVDEVTQREAAALSALRRDS